MSLSQQSVEIQRLTKAFDVEASKFHDIRLSTFLATPAGPSSERRFISPNHKIMLWQYYGPEAGELLADLQASNLQWGLRGAALTSSAVVEGVMTDMFVRMARRAGSLFDDEEAMTIKNRVLAEIFESQCGENSSSKPVGVTNSDPLAIWINYLLYHLSITNPGREHAQRIEPDPFSLSLLALERLGEDQSIGKIDRSSSRLEEIKFRVAMSFPGEKRAYVAEVVDSLRPTLGKDEIFYDYDYQAQLAKPNLDTALQRIYRDQSELVVVFLCAEYAQKQFCGLEWRAIRDIIKFKEDDRIMFIRLDDAPVDGVFSIDGFIDARQFEPQKVAMFIGERLRHLP
jgi:hypothetical protein